MAQDKSQTQRQKLEGMTNIPKRTYHSVVSPSSRRQLREHSLRGKGAKPIYLLFAASRTGFAVNGPPNHNRFFFKGSYLIQSEKNAVLLTTSVDIWGPQSKPGSMCRHAIRLWFGPTVSDDFPLHPRALFPWVILLLLSLHIKSKMKADITARMATKF